MSSEAKEGVDRICNCLGLRCLVFISYTSAQLSFGYEQSYCTNFHYQYIIVNFFQKQKDSILDVEAVEAHEMDHKLEGKEANYFCEQLIERNKKQMKKKKK